MRTSTRSDAVKNVSRLNTIYTGCLLPKHSIFWILFSTALTSDAETDYEGHTRGEESGEANDDELCCAQLCSRTNIWSFAINDVSRFNTVAPLFIQFR